ncbi:MAG: protoporphyrinogen oxidase HemJ [Gammaproteobacteria bacterium]|nr:protoporphyrinogen oxidase HemJ [Gammaproteobacteria bacterium]
MLWVKAFHIIFMVTWFAGLFYLPRLFVYHAMSDDQKSLDRFVIMERKLFWGIMTPSAILTIAFGLWLLVGEWPIYQSAAWMHVKLSLVVLLGGYHIWCAKLVRGFQLGDNSRSHVWYRWFNEVPVLFLAAIVILVIVQPF